MRRYVDGLRRHGRVGHTRVRRPLVIMRLVSLRLAVQLPLLLALTLTVRVRGSGVGVGRVAVLRRHAARARLVGARHGAQVLLMLDVQTLVSRQRGRVRWRRRGRKAIAAGGMAGGSLGLAMRRELQMMGR